MLHWCQLQESPTSCQVKVMNFTLNLHKSVTINISQLCDQLERFVTQKVKILTLLSVVVLDDWGGPQYLLPKPYCIKWVFKNSNKWFKMNRGRAGLLTPSTGPTSLFYWLLLLVVQSRCCCPSCLSRVFLLLGSRSWRQRGCEYSSFQWKRKIPLTVCVAKL